MIFYSQFFYFRIISEFLNPGMSTLLVYNAFRNSLLAKTLNLRDNEFANISRNKVLVNISKFKVFPIVAYCLQSALAALKLP